MQKATSLTRRIIWHHYPYVLPADVLSPELPHETDPSSLREKASKNGLYYLKLPRSFHDGTYLARVAAPPGRASLSRLYRDGERCPLGESAPLARPFEERIDLIERCPETTHVRRLATCPKQSSASRPQPQPCRPNC